MKTMHLNIEKTKVKLRDHSIHTKTGYIDAYNTVSSGTTYAVVVWEDGFIEEYTLKRLIALI